MSAPGLDFEAVWALVGRPPVIGALYSRLYETVTILAWEDAICGRPGWSWALVCRTELLDYGWTAGGRVDRDGDIHIAIERVKLAIAQPRGAA